MSFLKVNNRYVNLKNVSTINVLESQKRIIYNMAFSINILKDGDERTVSQYIYDDFDNFQDFEKALKTLRSDNYVKNNFITQGFTDSLINKQQISSFKAQENRRVIFNMSHSIHITNKNNQMVLAPEFVYVNFDDGEGYSKYITYLTNNLMGD